MSETRPLSAREAAEALGVSDRTIRRAILEGRLAATKSGRSFLIDPLALQRFRNGGEITPHAPQHVSIDRKLLIGREREIGAMLELLRLPETRLVTLTGPGGARALRPILGRFRNP